MSGQTAQPQSRGGLTTRLDRAVLALLRAPTYLVTVQAVEDLTGHCRRIHFSAPEFLAAHDRIAPTFWLRLWIPRGGQEYQRGYTVTDVRRDAGLFAVDFVLHDTPGVATDWARGAAPGASLRATVYTGKLFSLPEPPPRGCLLLGDPASLPAINDILRALPGDVPARVILQRQHADDERLPVHVRGGDLLSWAAPAPAGAGLVEALAGLDGDDLTGWQAWVATESGVSRRLRSLLQQRLGLPRAAIKAQGYWIEGRSMGRSAPGTGAERGSGR